ncbi:DUF4405 domain-containing protein [Methanofollis formosanus]|nr:DUF4405 domain-containing protein [Methanofollis formosanus]
MERRDSLYCIDMGMVIAFLLCGVTGILKWPGLVGVPGWGCHGFGTMTLIHDWSGLALCVLALVHVAMHWRWLAAMTRKKLHMR